MLIPVVFITIDVHKMSKHWTQNEIFTFLPPILRNRWKPWSNKQKKIVIDPSTLRIVFMKSIYRWRVKSITCDANTWAWIRCQNYMKKKDPLYQPSKNSHFNYFQPKFKQLILRSILFGFRRFQSTYYRSAKNTGSNGTSNTGNIVNTHTTPSGTFARPTITAHHGRLIITNTLNANGYFMVSINIDFNLNSC